jgi:hypothetical protein
MSREERKVPVRNSDILETFVLIVQGPEGNLRAVEMAGLGIAAEARCTLMMLADKSRQNFGSEPASLQRSLDFADCLIELGEIGDSLAEVWRARRGNELDDGAFSEQLSHLVRRLQEWPESSGLIDEQPK